jgi:hypothetical protein
MLSTFIYSVEKLKNLRNNDFIIPKEYKNEEMSN